MPFANAPGWPIVEFRMVSSVAAVVLGAFFIYVAAGNAWFAFQARVLKRDKVSGIPLIGGASGVVGMLLLEPTRPYWWLPLFLDWGCIPGQLDAWLWLARRRSKSAKKGPKTLRVMADYFALPLWLDGTCVDPRDVGIEGPLREELIAWGKEYTATLNMEDPAASGFESAEAKSSFIARGFELAKRVARVTGNAYRVTYFHEGDGRELPVADD